MFSFGDGSNFMATLVLDDISCDWSCCCCIIRELWAMSRAGLGWGKCSIMIQLPRVANGELATVCELWVLPVRCGGHQTSRRTFCPSALHLQGHSGSYTEQDLEERRREGGWSTQYLWLPYKYQTSTLFIFYKRALKSQVYLSRPPACSADSWLLLFLTLYTFEITVKLLRPGPLQTGDRTQMQDAKQHVSSF